MRLTLSSTALSPRQWQWPSRNFICLAIGLFLCSHAFADDAEARARFLKEYRPHAQALENYYGNMEVKFTRTEVGNENSVIREVEGKADLGHYLLTGTGKGVKNSTGAEIVHFKPDHQGRNPDYTFQVVPKAEGGYTVRTMTPAKEGEKSFWGMTFPYGDFRRNLSYLAIAEDQATKVRAFEDRVWQNEPVKVLCVEYLEPRFQTLITAEYYFSAPRGWICRGIRLWLTGTRDDYTEEIYFYGPPDGGAFPAPKRVEQWTVDRQHPGKRRRTLVTEITEFRHAGPFNDADFRLSAFGLPEPALHQHRWSWPLWLRFALGAAALAALAVFFAWLQRRLRKKSPPAQPAVTA